MPMKNPPHPGGVVLRQCIEPLGLTITDAAAALGVTRTTLSELVNGKRGISPEMAVRLSQVFGGSAESWLTQQAHYSSGWNSPKAGCPRPRPHDAPNPTAQRGFHRAHAGRIGQASAVTAFAR